MATQDELSKLWKLAGELSAARKNQAKAQNNALSRQKQAQTDANKNNWFGPTAQGAISGALMGFVGSGFNPLGAVAGGIGGAGVGYFGHEKFNENPNILPALGQAGLAGAAMSQMNNPISGRGAGGMMAGQALNGAGGMYQEMGAGRGLGLTPGLQSPYGQGGGESFDGQAIANTYNEMYSPGAEGGMTTDPVNLYPWGGDPADSVGMKLMGQDGIYGMQPPELLDNTELLQGQQMPPVTEMYRNGRRGNTATNAGIAPLSNATGYNVQIGSPKVKKVAGGK
jgi:hypothetical protein